MKKLVWTLLLGAFLSASVAVYGETIEQKGNATGSQQAVAVAKAQKPKAKRTDCGCTVDCPGASGSRKCAIACPAGKAARCECTAMGPSCSCAK